MSDPKVEEAIRQMETAANGFAIRVFRIAQIRATYVKQIQEMSNSLRAAVDSGELSAANAAQIAHQQRNQILEMQRARDLDLGRSLAKNLKTKGISFEDALNKAMKKHGFEGKVFSTLSGDQQNAVLLEVVESSGRSRPSVTAKIPRMRWAARGLWLITALSAAYNIGTAEDPWWQTGRESASIGGGFAGGAATGAVVGIWAGPIGVGIGVVVGGVLGALLADRAYVEVAGVSDKSTKDFIGRFTSFWTGTDETGLASALAREYPNNAAFTLRVFQSLNDAYYTDADDVALEYVKIAKRNPSILQLLASSVSLREYLIKLLDEDWTSAEEAEAIKFLRNL